MGKKKRELLSKEDDFDLNDLPELDDNEGGGLDEEFSDIDTDSDDDETESSEEDGDLDDEEENGENANEDADDESRENSKSEKDVEGASEDRSKTEEKPKELSDKSEKNFAHKDKYIPTAPTETPGDIQAVKPIQKPYSKSNEKSEEIHKQANELDDAEIFNRVINEVVILGNRVNALQTRVTNIESVLFRLSSR